jgi:hypothetical protein
MFNRSRRKSVEGDISHTRRLLQFSRSSVFRFLARDDASDTWGEGGGAYCYPSAFQHRPWTNPVLYAKTRRCDWLCARHMHHNHVSRTPWSHWFLRYSTTPFQLQRSKKMTQEVSLLTYIREMPCSNLGKGTDYTDLGFPWFSSVLPGRCRNSTLNSPQPLLL